MEFKGLSIIISASDLFVLIGWGRIGQGRVNELMDALKAVAFPKTGDGTRQVFFFQFQSYVVAIIVPDQETLEPWARSKKIPGNFADLCENEVRVHTPKPQVSMYTVMECHNLQYDLKLSTLLIFRRS